jgi:hypothetical protein
MSTCSAGAALVLGLALGACVGTGAEGAEGPPATAAEAPKTGTLEATGLYRGYSGKWVNVWAEDGKRWRFEVDERALPDWRKRFQFGERIIVTYRDLGSRRLPLAIGMKKAPNAPPKK